MALLEFESDRKRRPTPHRLSEMSYGQTVGLLTKVFLAAIPALLVAGLIAGGVFLFVGLVIMGAFAG